MSESIYDRLNYAIGSDDCDELTDAINDAMNGVSSVEDELKNMSDEIKDFVKNFESKTINEIQVFLEEIQNNIDEQSTKLY